MAIFNNSNNTTNSATSDSDTTIITKGSSIKGEMTLSCNLYIDGKFEGIINSQKEVNVGKNGHIKGDVFTTRLIIQGAIEGNVNSARVEIKAGGRISGTLESSELVIEAKGIFEGNSIIKNSSQKTDIKKQQIKKS